MISPLDTAASTPDMFVATCVAVIDRTRTT